MNIEQLNKDAETLLENLKPTDEESENYKTRHSMHIKKMQQLLKDENEWDYGFMVDILREMLYARLVYFSHRDCVVQVDESRLSSKRTLMKAVQLLDYAMDKTGDNFREARHDKNGNYIDDEGKAYLKAFKYIGTHIREWWD